MEVPFAQLILPQWLQEPARVKGRKDQWPVWWMEVDQWATLLIGLAAVCQWQVCQWLVWHWRKVGRLEDCPSAF